MADETPGASAASAAYRPAGTDETRRANAAYWDATAAEYQQTHAPELGDVSFVWSPEGAREDELGLLGDVAGRHVLEVGCGAAQCGRWLVARGARVTGFDLSAAQLDHARDMNARTGVAVALVRADAGQLPFRDAVFDLACSAYGALPFVANPGAVLRDVSRVLRPGGRWVFSVVHPLRWCLLDDPGDRGLAVVRSYFDRTPYVEEGPDGAAVYVEHHRTAGDWVRDIVAAGLRVVDLVEPEWRPGHETTFTQWGPVKGAFVPGTAIWVTEKPA